MHGLLNNLKTVLLMGLLMGLCLGIGYLIGGPTAMTYALVLGLAMNGFAYFFSDRIALATMRAREISREDDPALWEMVRMLAERADLPMPRVYVSPAAAPNAFATGRNPRHAAVCVTAGLRQMLNDEELAGVVAHELCHVKNRDILISAVATVIASAISYLAYMALWFGGGRDRREGNPLAALLLVLLAPLAAGLIQMAISRSREFEADRTGADLVGSPRGLARALEKLHHGSSQIPLAVPDAQANMFIVAPFTGRRMQRMFSTHPPVEERVARLMAMDRQHM
ncbi:MAG: zinc metalloprotease HtpX [Planctomycetes bacterium]|nr:zinc metalloprotease HtpX [Planctomycetota bacterium]